MPLDILVILVVVGISGVVLLAWWLGWSRPATLSSTEEAKAEFLRDYPGATVGDVILTSDGAAALLRLSENSTGLIFSFGDRFVTRQLTAQIVRAIDVQAGPKLTTVVLKLADFSAPEVSMTFASENFDPVVQPVLDALTTPAKAA